MGTPVCTCGHSHGSESSLCPIIGCPCKTFMDQRDEDLRRLNLQLSELQSRAKRHQEEKEHYRKEAMDARTAHDATCRQAGKLETERDNLLRLLGEAQDALKHIIGFYGPGLDGSPEEVAGKLARECLEKQGIKDFALKRVVSPPMNAEKVVQDLYPILKAFSEEERQIAFGGLWGLFCRTCYRLLDEGRRCHCWNDE